MIDGVVGGVIMSTLQCCCGEDFTHAAKSGWVKILSRMLDVIVPVVVSFEMNSCGNVMTSLLEPRLPNDNTSQSSSSSCPYNNNNHNNNDNNRNNSNNSLLSSTATSCNDLPIDATTCSVYE